MSHPARRGRILAGIAFLALVATARGGPILNTPSYNVTLPGGGQYLISGQVDHIPGTYRYSYTIQNLNKDGTRTFELGLASEQYFWGNYTETNAQGSPNSAIVLHDLVPHTTILPYLGRHNYVFTNLNGKTRVGISIAAGATEILSFDDPHAPTLQRWSLREITPSVVTRNNAILKVGKLPVPSAPEPSTLALAGIGLAGMGLRVLRRRRTSAPAE